MSVQVAHHFNPALPPGSCSVAPSIRLLILVVIALGLGAGTLAGQSPPAGQSQPTPAQPALILEVGSAAALLLQQADGWTWPQAAGLLDLDIGVELDPALQLLAGLRFQGSSDSPVATNLALRPGFVGWGGGLGLRLFPLADTGFNLALRLGLNTGCSNLTSLFFYFPSVELATGWLIPLVPAATPHSAPLALNLTLSGGIQFRQDPGPAWTAGLRLGLPISLASPVQATPRSPQ